MEPLILKNDYEPLPSGNKVHSSRAFLKVLVGGYGSGKTRCGVEEVKTLLIENPEITGFVMRKTMPSLRDSTMKEFLSLFPEELGTPDRKLDNLHVINGSDLSFRSLDEASKLKSTNPGFILLDEADEFTEEEFDIIRARIRQKRRPGDTRPPFPLHLIMVLNPVDEDHWIYRRCELKKHEFDSGGGCEVFHFDTRDNAHNLPPGYIPQVTAGMSPEEIERYIGGRWGTIARGAAVYGDIFNADLHLKKWKFSENMVLVRGWDFGFNRPACVFRLKDSLGRKNIDHEMLGDKEYLADFARRVIAQTTARYGQHIKIFDYCDPRGFDKSDKGQTSVEILNELGVYPQGERGIRAYVDPGIKAVRKELSTLIGGQPELTINPECIIIRAAYAGRYVRDDSGQPKKDGYYEHICDADRYSAYSDKSTNAVNDAMEAHKKRRELKTYNSVTGYGR